MNIFTMLFLDFSILSPDPIFCHILSAEWYRRCVCWHRCSRRYDLRVSGFVGGLCCCWGRRRSGGLCCQNGSDWVLGYGTWVIL